MFKSHPIPVFPFSCLVSTFPVILPRQIAVTPPNLGVLGKWADTRNVVAPSPGRTVWVQIPPGANFFRCRYKKIHIFPAKYIPYAFLLWADTRNVVAPSPARTVWVQIPPGANFFRCRYNKIHLFPAKYTPYAFFLWADTRNVVEPSPAQTPKQCGFKSH